ncbi:MAG: phage portal protein [Bacteroides sp.]|nr:phage portal protein [Bacteroides sp.]
MRQLFRRSKGDAAQAPASTPRLGAASLMLCPDGSPVSVATVYRCVKLLSEAVASLPLEFQRMREGVFREDHDDDLWHLLNVQPDPAISAFDFWRQVVVELLLDGNAYVVPVIHPLKRKVWRLALCSRHTVSHDLCHDTYTVSDITNGIYGVYGEPDIIHFKGLTLDSAKTGVSVLTYARLTMDIVRTADRETLKRFSTGGTVRGIVSNVGGVRGFGAYQDEELNRTADDIDSRFGQGENIVALPGDVGFKQLSLSSADMQFLESRKFEVREICRFFGVHPSFVYDDTSNNYKSAEQANMAFLSHTLTPMLRGIETELLRKLVSPSLTRRRRFRFDPRSLHACDLAGMADYRAKMLQTGATVNEVRLMGDLSPVAGGDRPLVSANLRGIDEALPGSPACAPDSGTKPGDTEKHTDNDNDTDTHDEKE